MLLLVTLLNALIYVQCFPPNECLEQCTRIMQTASDSILNDFDSSAPQFSLPRLYQASEKPDYAAQTYEILCSAYKRADGCLDNCQKNEDAATRIRQSYALLKIVCVEQTEEFLEFLPCFARNERLVIQHCEKDINATLIDINTFNEAVKEQNQHHIQSSIANLCKNINKLAKCLERPTIQHCGRRAAEMVLRFIALGFSGFEVLYEQMKITDKLPQSCLQLSSLAMYKQSNRLSVSRYKMMPQSSSFILSLPFYFAMYILIAILLLHF